MADWNAAGSRYRFFRQKCPLQLQREVAVLQPQYGQIAVNDGYAPARNTRRADPLPRRPKHCHRSGSCRELERALQNEHVCIDLFGWDRRGRTGFMRRCVTTTFPERNSPPGAPTGLNDSKGNPGAVPRVHYAVVPLNAAKTGRQAEAYRKVSEIPAFFWKIYARRPSDRVVALPAGSLASRVLWR